MNRLSAAKRVQVLRMLVEGMSMRGIARTADVAFNTVAKLLRDAGNACAAHHHEAVRGIVEERTIQCDEMWSFVYAKQRNLADAKAAPNVAGNVWTWTALDRDSKLIVSYLVSDGRDADSAIEFMLDLARRLERTPIIVTDALPSYVEAAQWTFGRMAKHLRSKAGTSHVERQNLTMRMGMRRFIRRTNGFSKRIEKHAAMLALWFHYYDFIRPHSSLGPYRTTPAMAAGLAKRPRSFEALVEMIDARAPKPNRPKRYRKRRVA